MAPGKSNSLGYKPLGRSRLKSGQGVSREREKKKSTIILSIKVLFIINLLSA